MYGMDYRGIYFFKTQKTTNMKVIIWIYENDLDTLLKGEPVDYFEKEPGFAEQVIQVIIDPDQYQQLKDTNNE